MPDRRKPRAASPRAHGSSRLRTRADLLIVPGWRGINAPVPPRLLRALTAAHERGARLASICSGAFVLAEAGLLDGNTATTHSRYAEALSTRFTHIDVNAGVLYVDDGRVLTSAGRAGKRKA